MVLLRCGCWYRAPAKDCVAVEARIKELRTRYGSTAITKARMDVSFPRRLSRQHGDGLREPRGSGY